MLKTSVAALPAADSNRINLPSVEQRLQEETMQQGNRVLARVQARVLTEREMQSVSGGSHTATKCTVLADKFADGDTGEC